MSPQEIHFEVREDAVDGGYIASAVGYWIQTEGATLEELCAKVKKAVETYFDGTPPAPKIIRLNFVCNEASEELPRNLSNPQLIRRLRGLD